MKDREVCYSEARLTLQSLTSESIFSILFLDISSGIDNENLFNNQELL